MKKLLFGFMAVFMTMSMTGCVWLTGADDGEEVVFVKKPWVFGSGGTMDKPLRDGSAWRVWTTTAVKYNVRPERYTEEFEDIFTSNNVPLGFNATIILKIRDGETPRLHSDFGKNWYVNNVRAEFTAVVRNNVRSQTSHNVVSNADTNVEIQRGVSDHMQAYIDEVGLQVDVVRVIMGRATPPGAVLEQIASTAAQDERKRTEDSRVMAESAREAAERQKAISDMAYMTQMDFSPAEYLSMRSLEIEREKIELVRNKENVHIIMNSGSGPSPVATFGVDK